MEQVDFNYQPCILFLNQSYFKHVKGVSQVRSELKLLIFVPFPNLLLFPEFSIFPVAKIKSSIVHARAQTVI